MSQPISCRTCLSRTSSKYRLLFKESLICGEKRKLVDVLREFIPTLQIPETDDLPKAICCKCSLTLKHFIRFRKKCLQTDLQFRTQPELCPQTEGTADAKHSRQSESDASDDPGIQFMVEPKEEGTISRELPIQEDDKPLSVESNETQNLNLSSKDPFECQYCHKILSNHKSYQYHLQLHSEDANFLCSCCGERFKTKMAYTGHMATHDPEKYKCDICGKSYRQAASLRNHKLNHSKEKPFICTTCGHSTTQKSGLKKHMLTHTESKSYVCDLCGEHFRFSSNLLMHKRRKHSREKNFVCSHCPKGFVSKDELLNHSMSHSDERPFGCDLCGKSFNRKNSLQFHQKHKHSVMAKIACHVCGRGFGQKVSLQNHLRTHILTD